MLGLGSSATGSSGGILGALTTRYKRIDVNEFQQLANDYLKQTGAAEGQQGSAAQQAAAGASMAGTEALLDAYANGTLDSYASRWNPAPASSSEQIAHDQAAAQRAADDQAAAQRAADERAAAEHARRTAVTAATPVSMPTSSIAPRRSNDYWNSHIAQFKGTYLPDGPSMRPNCGPASVTMALRMIGLDIPGFNGQRSEAVLDKARMLATGTNNTGVGTTDSELERLITASGGRWSESQNFAEISGWVKQGIPVVLSGNPSRGWNNRYSADQVYPFDGGHWVTVSGYDQKTGYYIVNDPLSQIGPIYVSEQELQSYNASHGQLGIAVFR